ncbi:cholesteryl ester transfer protein isoform 2-T2 [Anomaloglossus baeobatrachus]|uniref:cholesteryl ester transfer protein isoform X2 n=1 Tax=Anomaloglossus baeobatrachus TaxID=238106 RepID=UPI003F4F4498
MWPLILFTIYFLGISSACEFTPSSAQETGIVCRVTKPAALVLNEKTSEVIQAAFRHASFPNITGEKAVRFLGKVTYGLTNIQVSNLSIESSEVDLKQDDVVEIMIKNVSASFKGTLNYGYGTWFVQVEHSIDFEIFSSIDLQVNTKLTCGNNRVAADTSDCYLTFHQLILHLQGNKEPGWFKQLFTDIISFTLKLVLKGQICKEINYVANLLGGFIQDRADFLSYEDIGVNIDITDFPVIKENYLESHHKGFLAYNNLTIPYNDSVFSPSLLTHNRMLYFWFSEQVLDSLVLGYFLDQHLALNLTGDELKDILQNDNDASHQEILREILQRHPANDITAKVWSLTAPRIKITPKGTIVTSSVAVQISTTSSSDVYFETETVTAVQASYADKKLKLHPSDPIISIRNVRSSLKVSMNEEQIEQFLQTVVSEFGIPAIVKRLETALTSLMNSKSLNLFEIINPEIIPHEGYLIVQLDFGFPHHLLVDFLKRTL